MDGHHRASRRAAVSSQKRRARDEAKGQKRMTADRALADREARLTASQEQRIAVHGHHVSPAAEVIAEEAALVAQHVDQRMRQTIYGGQ